MAEDVVMVGGRGGRDRPGAVFARDADLCACVSIWRTKVCEGRDIWLTLCTFRHDCALCK